MAKKPRAPEVLADLSAKLSDRLISHGMDSDSATGIGQLVSDDMAADWGGQLIYFPMALADRRSRQIYEKFTHDNHAELANEFNVSVQHVYRVVKIMRQLEIARRQGSLFSDASDA